MQDLKSKRIYRSVSVVLFAVKYFNNFDGYPSSEKSEILFLEVNGLTSENLGSRGLIVVR